MAELELVLRKKTHIYIHNYDGRVINRVLGLIERACYLRGDEQRGELLGEEAVEGGVVSDQDLGDAVEPRHLLGHVLNPGPGASHQTSHLQ